MYIIYTLKNTKYKHVWLCVYPCDFYVPVPFLCTTPGPAGWALNIPEEPNFMSCRRLFQLVTGSSGRAPWTLIVYFSGNWKSNICFTVDDFPIKIEMFSSGISWDFLVCHVWLPEGIPRLQSHSIHRTFGWPAARLVEWATWPQNILD